MQVERKESFQNHAFRFYKFDQNHFESKLLMSAMRLISFLNLHHAIF